MAVTQVKRSIHKKQSAVSNQHLAKSKTKKRRTRTRSPLTKAAQRNNRWASTRHPERGKPAKRRTQTRSTLSPGSLGLLERKLPYRRFVDFPQVKGKTIERIHLYTSTDYHCITIDFKDQTCLNLAIEPSFTINAELQQLKKGNIEVVAEWPPIHAQT